jgi:hypothetical protein
MTEIFEDEEEMVRLAAEMSLQDQNGEFYDFGWDPNNLDSTKVNIRVLEEIMDGMDYANPEEVVQEIPTDGALTDEQLRAIFYTSNVGPNQSSNPTTKAPIERRTSVRGREKKIQETVNVICKGLTWYQNKIVHEIEHSQEVNFFRLYFVRVQCSNMIFLVRRFNGIVRFERSSAKCFRSCRSHRLVEFNLC